MDKIETKEDAKYFLEHFKEFAQEDDYGGLSFDFHDNSLNFMNRFGGTTRIEKKKNGFYIMSWRQGWSDQSPSYLDDPEGYVFEHRKDINKWI